MPASVAGAESFVIPTGIVCAGTELGLITVMYSAEKGFKGGFAAFHIAVLAGIVTFVIGVTGFIVAPLRQAGVLTIPEYYGLRYGKRTQILGGVILAFGGILNMGLFLKVGSMFIVAVTGLSDQGWALPAVMTALLALVLIYTVLGGMISVIVTDYIYAEFGLDREAIRAAILHHNIAEDAEFFEILQSIEKLQNSSFFAGVGSSGWVR